MMSKSALFMLPSYLIYSFGLILGLCTVAYCLLGLYTITHLNGEPVVAQAKPSPPNIQPVVAQAEPSLPKVQPDIAQVKTSPPKVQPDKPNGGDKQQTKIESNWQKADTLLNQRNVVIDHYLSLTEELNKQGLDQISRTKINLEREQVAKELDRINRLYKVASQDFGTAIAHVSPHAITHVSPQQPTLKTKVRSRKVGVRTSKIRLSRYSKHKKVRPARTGQVPNKA